MNTYKVKVVFKDYSNIELEENDFVNYEWFITQGKTETEVESNIKEYYEGYTLISISICNIGNKLLEISEEVYNEF